MSDNNEQELLERLVRLEVKIDMMMSDKSHSRRLDDLEDNQKFLWRTLLSTIMGGIMTLVIGLVLWAVQ